MMLTLYTYVIKSVISPTHKSLMHDAWMCFPTPKGGNTCLYNSMVMERYSWMHTVIYQWTRLTWREQSTDEGFLLQQSDTGRQIWFFCFPHKQFPQSTVWNQVNSLLLVLFNCKLTLLTCISLCSQMCPCSTAKGGRCLFPRPGPHWHQAEQLRCCPSGHGCSPVPECRQVELLTGTVVHRHVDWFPARSWLSKE